MTPLSPHSTPLAFAVREISLRSKLWAVDAGISWAARRRPKQGGARMLDRLRRAEALDRRVEVLLVRREDLVEALAVLARAKSFLASI